jgi:hypothetical protein
MLEKTTDPQMQLKIMNLIMELYRSIMQMATDGGVLERAMKMVKVLESQDISKIDNSNVLKECEYKEDYDPGLS